MWNWLSPTPAALLTQPIHTSVDLIHKHNRFPQSSCCIWCSKCKNSPMFCDILNSFSIKYKSLWQQKKNCFTHQSILQCVQSCQRYVKYNSIPHESTMIYCNKSTLLPSFTNTYKILSVFFTEWEFIFRKFPLDVDVGIGTACILLQVVHTDNISIELNVWQPITKD